MRIIGGNLSGLRLQPPANLPVRPTTDLAKESLFNIMQNRLDFEGLHVLDLFAGTGNISFELASRGVASLIAVDQHFRCVEYIKNTAAKLDLVNVKCIRQDVFKFISLARGKYDFIFADPPYDLSTLPLLAGKILDKGMLKKDGWLVVEHPSMRKMIAHDAYVETRQYGYSSFSFYHVTNEVRED